MERRQERRGSRWAGFFHCCFLDRPCISALFHSFFLCYLLAYWMCDFHPFLPVLYLRSLFSLLSLFASSARPPLGCCPLPTRLCSWSPPGPRGSSVLRVAPSFRLAGRAGQGGSGGGEGRGELGTPRLAWLWCSAVSSRTTAERAHCFCRLFSLPCLLSFSFPSVSEGALHCIGLSSSLS